MQNLKQGAAEVFSKHLNLKNIRISMHQLLGFLRQFTFVNVFLCIFQRKQVDMIYTLMCFTLR